MLNETTLVRRAKARITHQRPVDYDERTGIYTYRTIDECEGLNILTDAGRVTLHTYLYGSAGQRASLGGGLNYIALSNDPAAPAAGDLTLPGELSGNGLSRALSTVTLPTGSGNQTILQYVFTYTGLVSQGIQKTALFDAPVAGNMAHEIPFPQRTLFTNDTLTIQYSVQVG
jgi:hypothetical protein